MTIKLTSDMFDHRWPHAGHSLCENMVNQSEIEFAKAGITELSVAADFMAQVSEETGGGVELEENLNYSAPRLHQVWPSKFASLASAMPYAHNPRSLADYVYSGRMGNQRGTDDGWEFRGRGLLQVTGRSWYDALGILKNPEFASAPDQALGVALKFWLLDGINAFALSGNFRGETLRINGGYNGLVMRLAWRQIWRSEFGLT